MSPELTPQELSREEVFGMYVHLAARVTNLRTIIQNDTPLTLADATAWFEDYHSVMSDLMALGDLTVIQVKSLIRK